MEIEKIELTKTVTYNRYVLPDGREVDDVVHIGSSEFQAEQMLKQLRLSEAMSIFDESHLNQPYSDENWRSFQIYVMRSVMARNGRTISGLDEKLRFLSMDKAEFQKTACFLWLSSDMDWQAFHIPVTTETFRILVGSGLIPERYRTPDDTDDIKGDFGGEYVRRWWPRDRNFRDRKRMMMELMNDSLKSCDPTELSRHIDNLSASRDFIKLSDPDELDQMLQMFRNAVNERRCPEFGGVAELFSRLYHFWFAAAADVKRYGWIGRTDFSDFAPGGNRMDWTTPRVFHVRFDMTHDAREFAISLSLEFALYVAFDGDADKMRRAMEYINFESFVPSREALMLLTYRYDKELTDDEWSRVHSDLLHEFGEIDGLIISYWVFGRKDSMSQLRKEAYSVFNSFRRNTDNHYIKDLVLYLTRYMEKKREIDDIRRKMKELTERERRLLG